MTHRERNFQLKVEELLSDISNPEYRQIVVEVFVSYLPSSVTRDVYANCLLFSSYYFLS